ncbi:DUF2207 domain-containing protein [Streptococcus uberis]|uniref:DUF2207 domain-containing protein n=1 Tax=Streptococcus uberis TaxID=1349 RepID=UPI0027DE7CAE|nr:DUF2207 domain-containing protein [Streptococcus uberis]MCK1239336.1 DUF2207 domain-containing protein [Streptococcus uberis]
MKKWLFLFILFLGFFGQNILASEVDYRIPLYEGFLTVNEDNSADFRQEVTYIFSSDYNGQYLSLGKAGNMPDGFGIDQNPQVQAYKNGQKVEVSSFLEDLGDGYRLKVYNSGQATDKVKIVVTWKLRHLLTKYQDIAVLNWKPISDWDETLETVHFAIKSQKSSREQEMYLHRGYFFPGAHEKGKNQIDMRASKVSGVLEFHGYWDSSIVKGMAENQNHLPKFKKTEEAIAKNTRLANNIVNYYIYIVVALLFLLAGFCWYLFKKSVFRYSNHKDERLYALPGDQAPLVIVQKIFHLDLQKLNPSQSILKDDNISFENLVQATLLDLVDRKAILMEKEDNHYYLSLVNDSHLSDFEKAFVRMAFGDQKKLKTDQLFADYFFDSGIEKKLKKQYKGQELQRQVNQRGKEHLDKLDRAFRNLTELVKNHIGTEGDNYYRSMTVKEKIYLGLANAFLVFIIIILFCLGFYVMAMANGRNLIIDIVLALIAIVGIYQMTKQTSKDLLQGVLTQEGQLARQPWDAFIHMLKDIDHFEKAEVESLVVWNRMLVYASMFGFAEQVEKYMILHGIQLEDKNLGHQYGSIHPFMYGMTNNLTSSSMAATNASHFSVSSGSSSGGFSGGGFSGGGGGGGGGAF